MRRLALLLAALRGGGADLDAPMPMLKVTLHHGAADKRYAPPDADESLARIEFCAYCEDPHTEGSLARGLTALQGTRDYKITSKLVYALPNDAATPPMNGDELTGNVALVHRSATPLVQKILHAQEAGAVGVVLVASQADRIRSTIAGKPSRGEGYFLFDGPTDPAMRGPGAAKVRISPASMRSNKT